MPKILVVDDEAHIVRVLAIWLGRHAYDVIGASNGAVALDILERDSVDIIISDMNMPNIDGLELVRILREERDIDVPIMLLTARCDQQRIARQIRTHGVRVYPKPFVPSRLVADIDSMLSVAATAASGQTSTAREEDRS